jgi:hypothetical protein
MKKVFSIARRSAWLSYYTHMKEKVSPTIIRHFEQLNTSGAEISGASSGATSLDFASIRLHKYRWKKKRNLSDPNVFLLSIIMTAPNQSAN